MCVQCHIALKLQIKIIWQIIALLFYGFNFLMVTFMNQPLIAFVIIKVWKQNLTSLLETYFALML